MWFKSELIHLSSSRTTRTTFASGNSSHNVCQSAFAGRSTKELYMHQERFAQKDSPCWVSDFLSEVGLKYHWDVDQYLELYVTETMGSIVWERHNNR